MGVRRWHQEFFLKILGKSNEKPMCYNQTKFVKNELYMERFHGNGLKNLNSAVIGASLKRAPQLRVDLAFCHDIYIYIYRPADLCL